MTPTLAARAGRSDAPSAGQVAAWLFGELVPQGQASQEEAGLLLQLRGLQGAEQLPQAMVSGLRMAVATRLA